MKVTLVEIRSTHVRGFRTGVWGTIVGVREVTPVGRVKRLCYVIEFDDGVADYVPISDMENYETRAKG